MRALVVHAQGNQQLAADILHDTLQLAEPEGYKRVFLDHGAQMVGLLETVATRTIDPQLGAYVQELLDAVTPLSESRIPGTRSAVSTLIEPLSERELEVLRLLSSSLSSTEMAAELSISVNTLRRHLKNIYAKLDAHSRYEAIARAKEAGLL